MQRLYPDEYKSIWPVPFQASTILYQPMSLFLDPWVYKDVSDLAPESHKYYLFDYYGHRDRSEDKIRGFEDVLSLKAEGDPLRLVRKSRYPDFAKQEWVYEEDRFPLVKEFSCV